jgi:hypothetical protein
VGAVEATVKIIGELAWPVVVLTSVILLRHQLGRLFIRLTHLEAPGVKADFAEQAAATSELAEAAVPNAPDEVHADGQPLAEHPSLADLLTEAGTHPVGAIVRAWNLIDGTARAYVGSELHLQSAGRLTAGMLFHVLESAGVISDELSGVAQQLRKLRDKVVHGGSIPTTGAARDFVQAAWRLYTVIIEATLAKASTPAKPGDQ